MAQFLKMMQKSTERQYPMNIFSSSKKHRGDTTYSTASRTEYRPQTNQIQCSTPINIVHNDASAFNDDLQRILTPNNNN